MRNYLNEENYAREMRDTVGPFLAARREDLALTGYDGKPLAAVRYNADAPRGTVLIVHGFTESAEKYRELIAYFLNENLSVAVYDQRGHGNSYRAAPANVTHVDRFDEYVADAEKVMTDLLAKCPAPYYLFAHSMGGAVGALLLERHPDYFRRAVLSSPMIAPRHDGVPTWLSELICSFCAHTGRAKKRLFVAAESDPDVEEKFEDSCSLSRARFDGYAAVKRENPQYRGAPPTYRWTLESLKVTKKILKRGAPEKVKTPVLLFSADADTLVLREPQQKLADRLPDCKFVTVPAKHELYNADDRNLYPYLEAVLNFFEK